MRIIYWIGRVGDKFGSLERYNVLLAEACNQRGHEVIIMHDIPNTIPEYAQRLQSAKAELIVIGHTMDDPWHALPRAARLVRYWKPDVVHTHFVNPVALPVLKLMRVPLLYQTYHTGIDHAIAPKTRVIRWLVQSCTKRILAVSDRIRSDEIRAGVHPARIQTLPLGLYIRDFIASAVTCNQPTPPGYNDQKKKIVITVGRFSPEKGMVYVAEAAVEVAKKRPDVVWWLVGKDGPDKEAAWSLVQKSGVAGQICFLGQRNDVPSLMQKAYLQVVGSLFEGLPLMTLESSAFGVPTVGTKIGGLDEVVVDGVTGILVPRASSTALTEATLKLLNDNRLRDQYGQAAREHIYRHYDAERLVNDLLNMYEKDQKAHA
jgi:glycosyltransferase involved in cell wall biosynthesis